MAGQHSGGRGLPDPAEPRGDSEAGGTQEDKLSPDMIFGQSAGDGHSLVESLEILHRLNTRSELRPPSSGGAFPGGLFVEPLPVVVDANWLRGDIRYACQHQRRTVLVNAANEQFIRAFCARHVVEEVLEHSAKWAEASPMSVPVEAFRTRFFGEYLPVLRVVPDDGIPHGWLSREEAARLAQLVRKDADDVPSAMLALALRGLYVSKDGPALEAVYGDTWQLAAQRQWLDLLKASGDAGQLRRMLFSAGAGAQLVGYGAVAVARSSYEALGPPSLICGGALVWAAQRWIRQPSAMAFRATVRRAGKVLGEAVTLMEARRRELDGALPPPPEWEPGEAPADALVGRGVLQRLAREPSGEASAHELTEKLAVSMVCDDRHLRGLLRTATCFREVDRGRWQVGMAMCRAHDLSHDPD